MRETNRAERRHHVARLKKARKHYWGYPQKYTVANRGTGKPEEMDARILGMVVQNPQACSCEGCCNVRRGKWANYGSGLTRQEHRHVIAFQEGVDEAAGVDRTDSEE